MFVVIGLGFSLSTTLSDTDTERQTWLLVSHLRAYSPESVSERGGSAISLVPFLVKESQQSVRKTHASKQRGARSAETVTYATRTASAPLIQEHAGLPESCSREMWSFFPEQTSILTGADELRSSAGRKHST